MDEGRVYFDASAYMLFEASGDSSETQYYDGAFELESDAPEMEDDDALSCSYGSVISGRRHEVDSGDFDDSGGEEEDGGCISEEEEKEAEDGVVDQCRHRGQAEGKANPAKSNNGCEDSNVKMSEIEGDRLFWESCLAS